MTNSQRKRHERALAAIRTHPWTALLGAAALGFLLARIVRGRRF